jgi:hypothetical protein
LIFGRRSRSIHRELLWDWWAQEVAERLQQFYEDLAAGKRRTPPLPPFLLGTAPTPKIK